MMHAVSPFFPGFAGHWRGTGAGALLRDPRNIRRPRSFPADNGPNSFTLCERQPRAKGCGKKGRAYIGKGGYASMPSVFDYLDYREFLREYYSDRKSRSPAFSYQVFAVKAGFRSKTLLHQIIDGKRNISSDALFKIADALDLKGKAFHYFKDLVAYNQARNLKEKDFYFAKLAEYGKRKEATLLMKDQYEFYSRWYYNSLRELLPLAPFGDDFEKVGQALKPAITARQARQAVQVLERLGLIRKVEGRYEQAAKAITSGDEVQRQAVQNFHLQNLILAGESLDTCPGEERDVSSLIVALSPEAFDTIKAEIKRFRKKIAEIADHSADPNRVYHVNFQLFPVSRDLRGMPR
jgi:uncharacterized protein (TIGR02147 family)